MTIRPAEYCPRCGSRLGSTQSEGRERRHCGACDRILYRHPLPCAGVAVVDIEASSVLLVRRSGPPHADTWAIPAGIMEHDETPTETALRELHEETNVEAPPTALLLFDTWHHEHPEEDVRSVTVGYAVPRGETNGRPIAGSDAAATRFCRLDEEVRLRPGERERMRRALEAISDD